jgi:hypothetical protein
MPKLIQRIAWLLSGGEPRLVLTRGKDSFVLSAYKGRKPASVGQFLEKWPALGTFIPKDLRSNTAEIPVPRLSAVRLGLQSAYELPLKIEIAPDVLELQPVPVPNGFAIDYPWTEDGLERRFSGQADYFGGGWFIGPGKYWQVSGITTQDDEWLRLGRLLGDAAIRFLQQVVPEWQKRKLPIHVETGYSVEPAVRFTLSNVTTETAQLSGEWSDDPLTIRAAPAVPQHVIAGGWLRPGIAPTQVESLSHARQFAIALKGEEVPVFIRDLLPKIRNWTSGATKELEEMHSIACGAGQLILTVHREEMQGIGSLVATPEFVFGELRTGAEDLSLHAAQATQFIRVNTTWLPKPAVDAAGIGPFGRMKSGVLLGSTTLAPAEVLLRGSRRLQGPWQRIDFPQIHYPTGSRDFAAHCEFLLKWGVPAGVVGDLERANAALHDSLGKLVSLHPDARILVIGGKKTLDQIRSSWDEMVSQYFSGVKSNVLYDSQAHGIVFAIPKALEETPGLLKTGWSLLVLLEVDALIKTAHSKFFENVCRINSLLTLGSFASLSFRDRNAQREALAQVFKIPTGRDGEIVWKYGLRSLEPCPALPAPLAAVGPATLRQPHEIVLDGPAGGGVPIPARRPPADIIQQRTYPELRVQVSFLSPQLTFVEEARKLATYDVASAAPVPLQCYWPTYASMTADQKRWYFYWRGRVRAGQYLDTDLSYIFVHVYELINNIGCGDAEDGYRQLRALWLNYRGRYPKLDGYLADWIADYIILNHCNADPLSPYQELLSFEAPVHEPDLLLTRYATCGGPPIPLTLLASYSDYRLDRSKFYNETTRQIFSSALPEAFVAANKAYSADGKGSLLEHYRPAHTDTIARVPYRSAVFPGQREQVTLGIAYRYLQHAPFRELVTSTFKYFENGLRKKLKHGSLLRGMGLPSDVQTALDSYIETKLAYLSANTTPLPSRRIQIDIARVQTLTAESDQVREMLIAAGGSETMSERSAPPSTQPSPGIRIPRPEGTPDHLLTDLDEVLSVLNRLEEGELRLLEALMAAGWEAEDQKLRNSVGGLLIETAIGHINQLSLRVLGDLLVATEGTRRIVAEDFRDELEHLFVNYRSELRRPNVAGPVPAEWIDLRKRLSAVQVRVLTQILKRQDVQRQIAQIATECGSMPDTLVDGINDIAMDLVGDIIIDTHCEPPAVEDEDRLLVQQILTLEWSNAANQSS